VTVHLQSLKKSGEMKKVRENCFLSTEQEVGSAEKKIFCLLLLQIICTFACRNASQVKPRAGPSRATVGSRETFLRGPQTFLLGPLGGRKKIFEFFFQNGHFVVLRISERWRGPPNVIGPGVAYPPTPLSRPARPRVIFN